MLSGKRKASLVDAAPTKAQRVNIKRPGVVQLSPYSKVVKKGLAKFHSHSLSQHSSSPVKLSPTVSPLSLLSVPSSPPSPVPFSLSQRYR